MMSMQEKAWRYLDYITILALFFVLFPFIYLGFYNLPSGDDFCRWHLEDWSGYWEFVVIWCLELSGRYFNAIVSGLPIWYSPVIYRGIFLLFAGFFVFSVHRFVRALIPSIEIIRSIFIALILLSFLLLKVPDLTEAFYWLAAVTAYFFVFSMYILFWSYLIPMFRGQALGSLEKVFMAFLIFAIVGSHEVSMLILDITVFGSLLFCFLNNHREKWYIFFLNALAFVCSLAVYFLPGTSARREGMEHLDNNSEPLMKQVLYALNQSWAYLADRLEDGDVLFFLLGILFLVVSRGRWRSPKTNIFWLALLSTLIFTVVIHFTYYYSTGERHILISRVSDLLMFYFVLGATVSFFALGTILSARLSWNNRSWFQWLSVLICTIAVIKLGTSNQVREAYGEIMRKEPQFYNAQFKARYDFLMGMDKSESKVVHLPWLIEVPSSTYLSDLDKVPTHWKNGCYAHIFSKARRVSIYRPQHSEAQTKELLRKGLYPPIRLAYNNEGVDSTFIGNYRLYYQSEKRAMLVLHKDGIPEETVYVNGYHSTSANHKKVYRDSICELRPLYFSYWQETDSLDSLLIFSQGDTLKLSAVQW